MSRLEAADVDGLVALLHDDCSLQMPLFDEPLRRKPRIREFCADLTSRWAEIELTVRAAMTEGDVGMFELTFALVLPDGDTHADFSVDVLRYDDGLIRSLRAYTDSYPLRRALGIEWPPQRT